MEICGWRGGRGEREKRERERLYSLLLQQQLQLHLIRRHQGYFCNRSALTPGGCVSPSLIYSPDCRAERGGGGERGRRGGGSRRERRKEGERVGRSLPAPAFPAGGGGKSGRGAGEGAGPCGGRAPYKEPRNSRAGPPPGGLRAAPPAARTLFLKTLRALF